MTANGLIRIASAAYPNPTNNNNNNLSEKLRWGSRLYSRLQRVEETCRTAYGASWAENKCEMFVTQLFHIVSDKIFYRRQSKDLFIRDFWCWCEDSTQVASPPFNHFARWEFWCFRFADVTRLRLGIKNSVHIFERVSSWFMKIECVVSLCLHILIHLIIIRW